MKFWIPVILLIVIIGAGTSMIIFMPPSYVYKMHCEEVCEKAGADYISYEMSDWHHVIPAKCFCDDNGEEIVIQNDYDRMRE